MFEKSFAWQREACFSSAASGFVQEAHGQPRRVRGVILKSLVGFVRVVDAFNRVLGEAVAWLTLGCVLTCFAGVVLRYVFNVGYIWLQELYVWQHAIVFMVGAGYTFLMRGHVSVDVLFTRFEPRRKAKVEIFGTIVFLLPWIAVLAYTSAPFVMSSWSIYERSGQPGGMPALFLLKTVIWIFCFVVAVQGLALIARRVLFLQGHDIDVGTPNMLAEADHPTPGVSK